MLPDFVWDRVLKGGKTYLNHHHHHKKLMESRNAGIAVIKQTFNILFANSTFQTDKAHILPSRTAHSSNWLDAYVQWNQTCSCWTLPWWVDVKLHVNHVNAYVMYKLLQVICMDLAVGKVLVEAWQFPKRYCMEGMNKAGVQSTEVPFGLLRSDGKRPDSVTSIAWSKARCLPWEVTVPDTFTTLHISSTSCLLRAAAEHSDSRNRNTPHYCKPMSLYPMPLKQVKYNRVDLHHGSWWIYIYIYI